MKEYTYGKKIAVVIIHQLSMVAAVMGIFGMEFCMRMRFRDYADSMSNLMLGGLIGTFMSMAYITEMSGRRSNKDLEIHLHKMDKFYSDVLLLIFFILGAAGIQFGRTIHMRRFDFAGMMIAVGVLAYVCDIFFLIIYLSMVRRFKAGILFKNSCLYKLYSLLRYYYDKKHGYFPSFGKARQRALLLQALENIAEGEMNARLKEEDFDGAELRMASTLNRVRDGLDEMVKRRMRDERMKTDLITNVSHDIKTPLTSIVNYVELLKREELNNERAKNYIKILEEKSQRLKQLTEDLVEVSKISSGNINLDMHVIDLVELLYQTGGEYNERFEARNLTIVSKFPQGAVNIEADGRQLYRAIGNLYVNAAKYALPNTRVYVELQEKDDDVVFSIKNIVETPVNESQGDLTERFVRGEVSRSTEGSGLGLSIAKNLTELMGGSFSIFVDGDLFIATISFKMA